MGLVLLEALSLLGFGFILLRNQQRAILHRMEQRLLHQANSLALQSREGLVSDQPEGAIAMSVRMMAEAPSVELAKITDPAGKMLYSSEGGSQSGPLSQVELSRLRDAQRNPGDGKSEVFLLESGAWEGVKSIFVEGKLYGFAWVRSDRTWDLEQLESTRQSISLLD